MGQHHQEESAHEGTQAEERGGLITISHNVSNNITRMLKLKKLTGVRESFCELNFIKTEIDSN